MKEKPILFSGAMVRAILAGTKTQTRRIIKLPKGAELDGITKNECPPIEVFCSRPDQPTGAIRFGCPYGVTGDRLWIREAWALYQGDNGSVAYRADAPVLSPIPGGRWRASRYMPRWASRITLEVTDVRVERLKTISEADARAEGIPSKVIPTFFDKPGSCAEVFEYNGEQYSTARGAFFHIWEAINGKRAPWSSNPWVWAVSFKRVTS